MLFKNKISVHQGQERAALPVETSAAKAAPAAALKGTIAGVDLLYTRYLSSTQATACTATECAYSFSGHCLKTDLSLPAGTSQVITPVIPSLFQGSNKGLPRSRLNRTLPLPDRCLLKVTLKIVSPFPGSRKRLLGVLDSASVS